MSEKRFVRAYVKGSFNINEIWVDTQTGVNYFFHSGSGGYSGGLTPLLDAQGRPIVSSNEEIAELSYNNK